MKTADLKPGTLYSLRYSASYGSPEPLLLLSTTLHSTRSRQNGLTIAAPYDKAGRGHGYSSRDIGLPAIKRFDVDDVDTPEKLAAFYQAGREHLAAMLTQENPTGSHFQPAGFEDIDHITALPHIEVFTPQQFMGPWEPIKAQYDAAQAEERARHDASMNAKHAARADYDELVEEAAALGITSLRRAYGDSDRTTVEISRADLRKLLERFDPQS